MLMNIEDEKDATIFTNCGYAIGVNLTGDTVGRYSLKILCPSFSSFPSAQ